MPTNLDALLLAAKQAEARHETAYGLMQMLPAHNPKAPEWRPVWARLHALATALEDANKAYFAGLAQQREAIRLAGAGTYGVSYIVNAPTPTTATGA